MPSPVVRFFAEAQIAADEPDSPYARRQFEERLAKTVEKALHAQTLVRLTDVKVVYLPAMLEKDKRP